MDRSHAAIGMRGSVSSRHVTSDTGVPRGQAFGQTQGALLLEVGVERTPTRSLMRASAG